VSATATATARIWVDTANPGQFFACCGLLELADRLWHGAEGWFEGDAFFLRPARQAPVAADLATLLRAAVAAPLEQLDPEDETASPVRLAAPFALRLDWWKDDRAGGQALKGWAGRMNGVRIARAMQAALARLELHDESIFDRGMVVPDPSQPDNKVEPFYFDARRGGNAHPLDIGFSPDALQMSSAAYPAVELLCFIGLQRCRPTCTAPRTFTYATWSAPLSPSVAPVAAAGRLRDPGSVLYRFENAFRTDQRKHKAFAPATPMDRRRQ
jgi:CRISPR-associated protein Csb3